MDGVDKVDKTDRTNSAEAVWLGQSATNLPEFHAARGMGRTHRNQTRTMRLFAGTWLVLLLTLVAASGAVAEPFPPPTWWNGPTPDPPMDFRAVSTTLPFYGGIPLYGDMWKPHEPNDHSTDNHFHNTAYWSERYAALGRLRFNALVLYHPHPYPLFVDYGDTYPEAAWLTPDELAAKQAILRWHIAEAGKHGIKLYFLTWDIWTPRGFAEAHGIGQHSVDTPLVREYSRWTIQTFFETFPGLGGLATMAGEAPVGCIDYLRTAVVPALKAITPRPGLVLFTWCAYPDQAKAVLNDYDGPSWAMHYLQYEHLFMDRADPRIGMYSRDMGGQAMAALGMAYIPFLYFGDPEMVHGAVSTLYRDNNGRGMLVQGGEYWGSWLAELAYARYLTFPEERYDDAPWEAALADRYGSEALAKPLLRLLKEASQVMPTQMLLTHSQSDHFHPQVGLSLGHMLEIPTISTYIFENSQTLDERGYLEGNLGLSHPNPDWGVRVAEIGHAVRNDIADPAARKEAVDGWIAARQTRGFNPRPFAGDELMPMDVVARLENRRAAGRKALEEVRGLVDTARRNREELDKTLERVEVNLAFADYFAKKDRAAIAYERYRILGQAKSDRDACLRALEDSVDAWKTYAARMDAFIGGPIGHWRFWSASPPPYAQNDFWYGYVNLTSNFSEMTPYWERELEIVRKQLGQNGALVPPIMDELRPSSTAGEVVARIGFEPGETAPYHLEPTDGLLAQLIDDASLVLEGKRSLLADSRDSDIEWNQYLSTDLEALPFTPNTRYEVHVRYRAVDPGPYAAPFAMFLRSARGGIEADKGENRTWGQSEWVLSERVFAGTTGPFDDYRLCFALHGKAALVIDDIVVRRIGGSGDE